jgi:hypothetical protein
VKEGPFATHHKGLCARLSATSEDTVQHRLEPGCEQSIATFVEVQPIGRERRPEPPVAVEQHVADFGVNV